MSTHITRFDNGKVEVAEFLGTFFGIILIIAVVGILVRYDVFDKTFQSANTTTQQPISTEYLNSFSSTGSEVEEIYLTKGKATFDVEFTGSGTFKAALIKSDGTTEAVLMNTIGSYRGTNIIDISATDTYKLNVITEGDWTITVK